MSLSKNPSAFEKRVKRRIIARQHEFFAVCSPGLESLCRSEMDELGDPILNPRVVKGGVAFEGRLEAGYLANLHLRSPSRLLLRLASFKAANFPALEKSISSVDWELFLPSDADIRIQVSCKKSRLFHSDAIAQRCRPIIQSRLSTGAPQESGSIQTLMIRAENDRFQVSLDMSGALLHRRGIKGHVISAPLRETLAFALLKESGFHGGDILVDPMCGSGTFSIEAAMIRSRVPPGFFRSFAFEAWPGFRPENFNHLKKKAKEKFILSREPEIFASDLDPRAVDAVRANISAHEFLNSIRAEKIDFFDIMPRPSLQKGVILLNPPYGKRLGQGQNADDFYHEIGQKLTRDFKGWRLGILCPDHRTRKELSLKQLRSRIIFHGGLNLIAGFGVI
ncbi:THUMP domain-containing class I SAM-dependent RNA methyltransferase [Desulfospira joergensenii]|uniref:THUMP domain-containing class I SAM-dependent RNA methyltransferase n=1 Tax=Desulfospira joergensenii TaxID=53329 RepID=UPI0003B42531|nr:RNA methyltransferase [Desulfospira joergensenii]